MFALGVVLQLCAPFPAGGSVVTERRGGGSQQIVATARDVHVSWVETYVENPGSPHTQFTGHVTRVRSLDPANLAARAAPTEASGSEMTPYIGVTEAGLGVDASGRLLAASCSCTYAPEEGACAAHAIPSGPEWNITGDHGLRRCPDARLSLATVGANTLAAFAYQGVRAASSATPSHVETLAPDTVSADTTAIAPGAAEAVVAWRSTQGPQGRRIDARIVGPDARPAGPAVELSTVGDVGAPAVTFAHGSARAVFAQRSGPRAPYVLQLVEWAGPAAPTRAALVTGTASAMAPAVLAAAQRGCLVVSWTEGAGRATVVRAGRVCDGTLDAASVQQVSRAGVEAGDSELATDGTTVYIAWQEIPAQPQRHTEIRVARLGCR